MKPVRQDHKYHDGRPGHVDMNQIQHLRQTVIEQEELDQDRRSPEERYVHLGERVQHRDPVQAGKGHQKSDNDPHQQRACHDQRRDT